MASHEDAHPAMSTIILEELRRLREHLETLREHLRATTEFTEKQEAVVNKIRAQLYAFDPTKADLPQTQNWYELQKVHNIEKGKLDEVAKQQNDYMYQVRAIEEKATELAAHWQGAQGAQGAFQGGGDEVSGPDTKDDEMQEMDLDGDPTTQNLFRQLTQTQAQLRAMSEERTSLQDKNLALAKRSAILSREMREVQEESKILRTQRNILQGRLDNLEDQDIDIGEPRNDLEAEARASRRRQREQFTIMRRAEGSGEINASRGLDTAFDFFQGAVLETELQNATDEMEDQTLEIVKPQKKRESLDSLFSDGSDELPSEDSLQISPFREVSSSHIRDQDHHENHTSTAWLSTNSSLADADMVYGDENSEDLIDWTDGDEDQYRVDSHDVDSSRASNNLVTPIRENNPSPLLLPQASPTLLINEDCEEKLAIARAEYDLVKQQRDEALAELEQTRRDLATRTAERNGARQRMSLLDEEIAERETREVQLREQLRLEREKDSLADKLVVELHELREKYEEVEQERVAAEEKIQRLQDELIKDDVKRTQCLETAVEASNSIVEGLERQLEAANAQLSFTSAALNGRQLEIQRIGAEFQTARKDLETARAESKAFEASLNTAREERNRAQAEVKSLNEKFNYANEQRSLARAEARDLALETKRAVAAAEKANDVVVELRRSLNASNDMGHRLRRISSENVREVVVVRDQRDSALHGVSKLTRDLTTARQELDRLRAERDSVTQDVNRARASLIAVTVERDIALKECADLSQQLTGQNQRVEEHLHSVRVFSDENEKLLATQEDLRSQIQDLSTQLEQCQAANQTQVEGENSAHTDSVPQPTTDAPVHSRKKRRLDAVWIDQNLHYSKEDDPKAVDIPDQLDSPTLFVSNSPVAPAFPQPASAPIPAPGTRKSTRATRNPAPIYDSPSPSVPRHSRRKKRALAGTRGSTKKK
jgi:chromosome segregation ATPase